MKFREGDRALPAPGAGPPAKGVDSVMKTNIMDVPFPERRTYKEPKTAAVKV
jgi:hypothetical protein